MLSLLNLTKAVLLDAELANCLVESIVKLTKLNAQRIARQLNALTIQFSVYLTKENPQRIAKQLTKPSAHSEATKLNGALSY